MAPLRPKFYYLAPTLEVPPEGPITLGSIISEPRLVNEPINDYLVPPKSYAEKVYLHNAPNSRIQVDSKREGHGGIFADFLQYLPLGLSGNIDGKASNKDNEDWTFDNLQTIWFTPSTEYVKKSLEDRDMQDFIYENKTWLGRTKLYMVVGVKVAYGASSTISYAQERGGNLHIGFDFTPLGVPITVGPDGGYHQDLTVTQTGQGGDPFVFAFRLRQVKISPAGDVSHKDYNDGALLSLHGDEKDEKTEIKIVVEGLEDFDADASDFHGLQSWDVVDEAPTDEGGCKCAMTS
jgi:hypothetical protein